MDSHTHDDLRRAMAGIERTVEFRVAILILKRQRFWDDIDGQSPAKLVLTGERDLSLTHCCAAAVILFSKKYLSFDLQKNP